MTLEPTPPHEEPPPTPQKARKKAKKSETSPPGGGTVPALPTTVSEEPAAYHLCAVELRACARQVRGWKTRMTGFLEGGLRPLLAVQEAAVARIGFPPVVSMERLEDRLWCWTVFQTPTTSTTLRVPYGPRADLAVERQSDQVQRIIDEHASVFTKEQKRVLLEIVDQMRKSYEGAIPAQTQLSSAAVRAAPLPRGYPKSAPPTTTDELASARKRAEVPPAEPPSEVQAALEAMRGIFFQGEYEPTEMIAGAFETFADCVDFLADFKPPTLDSKAEAVLMRMFEAGATSERRGIQVKRSAANWAGPLGTTPQTRERAASSALASLKRNGLAAPEHPSERAYLTMQGLRAARAVLADRAHQ